MADIEESRNYDADMTDARLKQLLQVWRDYYDEIFECDLRSGSFESMMESKDGRWPKSGFAGIEIIILAEKIVHPDDKEAFREFFDLDGIARRINEGIYVTKLNFRIMHGDGTLAWVKVKNIVPTKQVGDDIKFFSCFRRVDDETSSDLRYKQGLVDALEAQRLLCEEKEEMLNRVAEEIRSPLTAIIGMSALAKTDTSDPAASRERFKMIEAEGIKMNRVLRELIRDNVSAELPEFEFEDHPVNKISYGRKTDKPEAKEKDEEDSDVVIPANYAFISNLRDNLMPDASEIADLKGKRLLIVENNRLNVEVMKELMTKAGAEYDLVSNGREAVVRFISKPAGTYDLILMDTDLIELDGYSAVRCIRIGGKDDSETVPVFAIIANATTTDIRKAYKYRFDAVFSRPVDFTMLFRKIKEQLYGIH